MGALDEHVADQIAAVEESLTHVDEVLGNLDSIDYNEVVKSMTPLERARYDLTNLYAINSLFWMYMRSFGENPHAGAMKDELDRIKKQMMRVSEIANKAKMPRINKDAANRMVRHELWEPASGTTPSTPNVSKAQANEEENWDEQSEPMETDGSKSRKRKLEESFEEAQSSKRENPEASSSNSTSEEEEDEEDDGEVDSSSVEEVEISSGEEEESYS